MISSSLFASFSEYVKFYFWNALLECKCKGAIFCNLNSSRDICAVSSFDEFDINQMNLSFLLQVHAQLSFHGHRDSVKFFVSVPGQSANLSAAKAYAQAGARPPSPATQSPTKSSQSTAVMIMSGGEG